MTFIYFYFIDDIYLLRSLLGLLPMFPLSVQCSVRVSLPIECV